MTEIETTIRRRRNWLSFNLRTLFLAVTVAAVAFGYPHIHRYIQFQRLKAFVGQDIRTLPESQQHTFAAIVDELLPDTNTAFFPWENWFVWRLPTDNGIRFVLFQGEHIMSIPGTSCAHIYLFNHSGRLVGQSSFSTGWRIDIADVAILPNQIPDESIICIKTAPVINGKDIAIQYYAIIDDRVVLLRLEDSGGKCIPNHYAAPNHTIGPEPIARTDTEWIRALADPRSTEILRTLTWLGGSHHSWPVRDPGNVAIEDFDQATLHNKVRQHPDTKANLVALAASTNTWISDAAQLALQTVGESQ